jgi:hypothetical protein
MTMAKFVEHYRAIVGFVVDVTDVDKIIAAKGSWSDVSGEVARLVAGSALDKSMFGFAEELVSSAAFGLDVQQLVNRLDAKPRITQADVDGFNAEAAALVQSLGSVKLGRRIIEVEFVPGHKTQLPRMDPSS